MNLKMLAFRAVAVSVLLLGCGKLVDMGGGNVEGQQQRIFLSDAAPAESLPSVLIQGGVYFTMQPGKSYQLRVRTPIQGQQLQVLRARGEYYYGWKTFTPTASGDSVQYFTVTPDPGEDSTRFYRAFLQSGGGGTGLRPQTVRLVPAVPAAPPATNALRVKLVLVRQMTLLPDAQKAAFAQAFLSELASIYATYGITVTGTYEIAEPAAPRLVVDFGGGLEGFSTVRNKDTAYLYLVDALRYEGTENPNLLGFAPREGITLQEDFVILNASGIVAASTPAAKAAPVAVTAAHELGHLLGLRHTRPSAADFRNEFDKSNTHDGFGPAENCEALPKRSGGALAGNDGFTEIKVGKRYYCLRAMADFCGCSDETNLMYAYQCPGVVQKTLLAGQQDFLRWNISVFR
jgi:hypothetical protein